MFFRDDTAGWDGAAISIALMLLVAPIALTFHMAHRGDDPAGPDPRFPRGNDMVQFWMGAAVLESGGPAARLYDADAFARSIDAAENADTAMAFGPTYPPPIYQVFDALDGWGRLPATKALLWSFLLASGLGIALLLRAAGHDAKHGVEAGLLLWSAPATMLGVATGQPASIWLVCLAGGLALRAQRYDVLAGAAFGLLCIKPTVAAPVLLAMLLTTQWRSIGGFVIGGGVVLLLSIARDGVDVWRGYFEMLLLNPDLTQQLWSNLDRHFSFRSLVSVPFAGSGWAAPIGALGSVAAIVLALWFRRTLTSGVHDGRFSFGAFAILLGACAFATPHLLDYDLVIYFPLMIWAGDRIAERRARHWRAGIAVLLAFYLVPIAYPLSARIHFSLGSLTVLSLLIWCASEISRGEAGAGVQAEARV